MNSVLNSVVIDNQIDSQYIVENFSHEIGFFRAVVEKKKGEIIWKKIVSSFFLFDLIRSI